ncbi:MAG: sugar phosphate isomerase/epimerase [Planctomycetaceae bacterium]
MLIAASSHCFGDKPFPEACQALVDLGYDKVELWLKEDGPHLKPSEVAEQAEKFVTFYRETTRLTPVAIHFDDDVTDEIFQAVCRLGKMMKITQVTIPAGQIGTPFNEEIDRLRRRLAATNSAGMRLSLKTKTGHLTEDPQTAIELCQAVPGLGLTLDLSYYVCGKYANKPYDQVYAYVYHAHLRDTSPTAVQVPIGLGEIDYSRMISQLKRCEYNRILSVEILPELLDGMDRALEMRKLRMLLETLL